MFSNATWMSEGSNIMLSIVDLSSAVFCSFLADLLLELLVIGGCSTVVDKGFGTSAIGAGCNRLASAESSEFGIDTVADGVSDLSSLSLIAGKYLKVSMILGRSEVSLGIARSYLLHVSPPKCITDPSSMVIFLATRLPDSFLITSCLVAPSDRIKIVGWGPNSSRSSVEYPQESL